MAATTGAGGVLRILLVEDNYGDVLLTQHAFNHASIATEMTIARDGEEAINLLWPDGKATTNLPDIVLLDLNLPKIDGKEVLAAIRADAAIAHLPVIVLTSSSAEQDVVKTYRLNTNGYLLKPINLDSFKYVMQSIEEASHATLSTGHDA